MKKECLFKVSVLVMSLGTLTTVAKAEEPAKSISIEAGADVVSSYIWRGQDCGGFSIQPSLTISHETSGLSFNVWASAELFEGSEWANMNEFDLALSWSKGGLSLGLTDYNFCTGKYFGDWTFNGESSHNLEANLGYDFGPLALSWNTMLTGSDHRINNKGELTRNYSTYFEISAPWKLVGVEGSAAIGASLWDDAFTAVDNESFNICNISVTATKEFFKLPFSASVIANPQTDKVYFVIGVTL